MNKWREKLVNIEYQNRWVECVVDNTGNIIFEVGNLSKEFIEHIITKHNDDISKSYESGLYEGVDIIRKEIKSYMAKEM